MASLTPQLQHGRYAGVIVKVNWQAIPECWQLKSHCSRQIQNCDSVQFWAASVLSRVTESDINEQTYFFFTSAFKIQLFFDIHLSLCPFVLTLQMPVHCNDYNIHYSINTFLFIKGLVRLRSITGLPYLWQQQNFCLAFQTTHCYLIGPRLNNILIVQHLTGM